MCDLIFILMGVDSTQCIHKSKTFQIVSINNLQHK
jgi:hypothetical protein